jgi:sirohydrochlorin ferrochelatase
VPVTRARRARRSRRAILLVDHGSRSAEANRVVAALGRRLRRRRPEWIVHWAHLDVRPPTIADGIDRCVADGATEIVVHPYFLAPGMHSRRDVPALARAALGRHRGVRLRVSEPLGVHDALLDVVVERVGRARGGASGRARSAVRSRAAMAEEPG